MEGFRAAASQLASDDLHRSAPDQLGAVVAEVEGRIGRALQAAAALGQQLADSPESAQLFQGTADRLPEQLARLRAALPALREHGKPALATVFAVDAGCGANREADAGGWAGAGQRFDGRPAEPAAFPPMWTRR